MKQMDWDFGRRKFLKGAALGAGATLLGPMLNRLALAAEGKEARTPRFLFVVEGNGLPPKQVHPEGLPFVARGERQATTVQSLLDQPLPPSLKPVEAFRNRMAIVQGLSGRMCTGGHSSDHGALGAYHASNGRNIQGPTIDAALGQRYPGIYPNIVMGIASDPNESVIFNCSAARQGRSLPTMCKPEIAFSRMFGSVAEGEARNDFAAKRNLMDHLQNDVKRVRRELNGVEKEKLDSYLSAYETIGRTSQRLVEIREPLGKVAPVAGDKYKSSVETDRLDAHFEMAAAGLIGGVTNVMTIASGVGFPYFNIVFKGLGIERGKHPIGHSYRISEADGWAESEKIRRLHFELIARFLNKMASVKEGDGTMLDNTVVVYLSDAAEEHHSTCFEWPFVVIGNCNGKLRTSGQYVSFANYGRKGHRTINTLYNTLLHAAGAARDNFGVADPNLDAEMSRGPLGELLV